MAEALTVLTPVAEEQTREEQAIRHLGTVAGKTVGFLSAFWPPYKPLVEDLTQHFRTKLKAASTPRADYYGRPPLKEVWRETKEFVDQLDAAVVGIGA